MFSSEQHKVLWRLAGPIMISNISIALLGMVDTAVVGHLDHAYYLGGVTLAMVVFNFLYWGLSFLRMGTTGIVAQQFGANNPEQLRSSLFQAITLALILSLVVLIFQSSLASFSFSVLQGSDDVKYYANEYFDIAIWAVPAMLLNLVITGWLLGMQRATYTLFLAVFINLLNIILDIVFVVWMQMDVQGVALATVIAQYSGLILAFILCKKILLQYPGDWHKQTMFDISSIKEMLSVNHNLFLRTLSLIFVFAFFTDQSAGQGDDILAANAILKNFYLLIALGLDGFATAAEALTGKSIGVQDHQGFWKVVKTATQWGAGFAVLFSLCYWLFGEYIISLMTSIDSVKMTAGEYLIWIVFAPIISVWCFIWDGVFIGARKAKDMRNSMLIATVLVFVPAWYLSQGLGNHGLWLAFILFLLARTVTMTYFAWKIEQQNGFVTNVQR